MKFVLIAIFAAAVMGRLSTLVVPVGISVQAAQPAPPTVTPCELVNTFGAIEIARCTPENGMPYLINSLGFMLNEG